jgi:hypothetical protein
MPTELPKIKYKRKNFTFDVRLGELRTTNKRRGLSFVPLDYNENKLMAFAVDSKDRKLITENMKDLEWKFKMKNIL